MFFSQLSASIRKDFSLLGNLPDVYFCQPLKHQKPVTSGDKTLGVSGHCTEAVLRILFLKLGMLNPWPMGHIQLPVPCQPACSTPLGRVVQGLIPAHESEWRWCRVLKPNIHMQNRKEAAQCPRAPIPAHKARQRQ